MLKHLCARNGTNEPPKTLFPVLFGFVRPAPTRVETNEKTHNQTSKLQFFCSLKDEGQEKKKKRSKEGQAISRPSKR
jgi:hypothetical protein